jgi:hypothetical protein
MSDLVAAGDSTWPRRQVAPGELAALQFFDRKNCPTTRRLEIKQFERLIKLIQPRFPNVKLPLTSA